MLRHSLIPGVLVVTLAVVTDAAAGFVSVYYSADVPIQVSSLPAVFPSDAYRRGYQPGDLPASLTSLRGVNLDALSVQDGKFVFSLDVAARVSGFSVVPGDVLQCDDVSCTSFTILLDGMSDLPRNANVDAVAFDPDNGDLLYSLDADATVDGMPFRATDVIRWNGTTHGLVFDGTEHLMPGVNVDAIDVLPGQKLLFSVDVWTPLTAGPTSSLIVKPENLVEQTLGADYFAFSSPISGPCCTSGPWRTANLDAFHVDRDSYDHIFADGFD